MPSFSRTRLRDRVARGLDLLTLAPAHACPFSLRDLGAIAALGLLKTLLVFLIFLAGFRLLMNDEAVRWTMTRGWIDHPFLAPADHVWLGGFFYLNGTIMKFTSSSFEAAKCIPLVFSLGAIAGLYELSRFLHGNRYVASCLTFVFTTGAVATWLSVSFMPEMYTIFFQTWGLLFLLKGLETERTGLLLLGCAGLACTTSFRYEQWLLAFAADLLLIHLRATRQVSIRAWLGAIVILNSYIALWCGISWVDSGDPLLPLRAEQALTVRATGNPLTFLWDTIRIDDPVIFLGGGIGLILAVIRGSRTMRIYAFLVVVFSILFLASLKIGTALSTWRVIQGWRTLLIGLLPLPLWLIEQGLRRRRIRMIPALVALGLLPLYLGQQQAIARDMRLWGFSNATWSLGEFLRFERNNPVLFKEFGHREPTVFFVGSRPGDEFEFMAVDYLSGLRRLQYDTAVSGTPELVITRAGATPTSCHVIQQFGEWNLCRPADKLQ